VALKSLEIDNEIWFKIPESDSIRPFLMSIVSDSNHWMFVSSNGGITAGRKNADYALFPYYTDDKLTENAHSTGSKTIIRLDWQGRKHVWEPFIDDGASRYDIIRNVYKNRFGNKIIFEEENRELGLVFRYRRSSSNLYGFVRNAELENRHSDKRKVFVLDGIQNILPYGVGGDLQEKRSNLVDAYKRSELVEDTRLGIFALSAIIVDKAEPSEALRANVAWSVGLDSPTCLLSSKQLEKFREFDTIHGESDVKGERGAYFLVNEIELESKEEWMIVANVNQDHAGVVALNEFIRSDEEISAKVGADVELGTENLKELVEQADGLQLTADPLKDARHYSNVLFNIMRGGIFDRDYTIEKRDFLAYLQNANSDLIQRQEKALEKLPEEFENNYLEGLEPFRDDPDFRRLAIEYLPLKFSRRHGDPSRPWNKFSINTRSEVDGSKILDYEGNWRDIFQNWEALAHSYPDFMEGMIYKFLNASTFDGYNPYRVTKGGFDWETIEPDDPWSYIGYWGDHQIIYLLKFLEFYRDHDPEGFSQLFRASDLVYAHVPYRIKSYEDILSNPKDTIDFDQQADRDIRRRVEERGADGALLQDARGIYCRVTYVEKILATTLAKISNFIPEAGIWMNTQRPEWNDANNALVGNGVSVVTLCYLRRFLKFFHSVMPEISDESFSVSKELKAFFNEVYTILNARLSSTEGSIDDVLRRKITDALGKAGSKYRSHIYDRGFSGEFDSLSATKWMNFLEVALQHTEHAIRANRRDDGLYHAYNLISVSDDGMSVSRLEEMLEGQVAALSSGLLTPDESLEVLDALRGSELFREDQQSYMLYPNKDLPRFLEKNNIPHDEIDKSTLLKRMVADGRTEIIKKDVKGNFHFNGNFKNARDLHEALEELSGSEYSDLVEEEGAFILDLFEKVFDHRSFTGRSGTFFADEGLGSIYWHMVSKLHLAVTEVCLMAKVHGVDEAIMNRLVQHFDEIGEGIGIHKDPGLYGGFPTDPYSHTPAHRGAQQPGMTGQVKEDILVRFAELGLRVENGEIFFDPFLLKKSEFLAEDREFELQGKTMSLPKGSLGFSICSIPVVFEVANRNETTIEFSEGNSETFEGTNLSLQASRMVFSRDPGISRIKVSISRERLR
jgi:hypothetical protein